MSLMPPQPCIFCKSIVDRYADSLEQERELSKRLSEEYDKLKAALPSEKVLSELKHLYTEMCAGRVKNVPFAARTILGPAIIELEKALKK